MRPRTGLLPALRFLLGAGYGRKAQARAQPARLPLPGGGALSADLYEPLRGPRRGALVFVHGMSWRGHRDHRVRSACEVLAASGYQVWAPRFPDIVRMRIRERSIDRIAQAAVAAAGALGPGAQVGVVAPSFSAGMALRAAARPEARGAIAAVLAIGAYTDAARAVRFLVSDPEADPYGRLIVLRDRLHRVTPVSPSLRAALLAAIHDLGHAPPRLLLPEARAGLGAEDRALLERAMGPPGALGALGEALVDALEVEMATFTVTEADADALTAQVSLLHGSGDPVIPPSESVQLHALLRAHGVRSHLAVTALLSHGDTSPSAAAIATLPQLFGALRAFFAAVPAPP